MRSYLKVILFVFCVNLTHFNSFLWSMQDNERYLETIVPSEILDHIVSYLDVGDFKNFLLLSNFFYSHMKANTRGLRLSTTVTENALKELSSWRGLKKLSLANCYNLTDENLVYLSSLSNLQCLDLSECGIIHISNQGLNHISNLSNLTDLNVRNCKIEDDDLIYPSNFCHVQMLNLAICNITDAGLVHLSQHTKLKKLNLISCHQLTGEGLSHLSTLADLTGLEVLASQMTEQDFRHLSKLGTLQFLNLDLSHMTDNGLIHICNLNHLTDLSFQGDRMTDQGFRHISKLSKLQFLDLHKCNITDNALIHLSKLTNLTILSLYRCQEITDQALSDLKSRRPNSDFRIYNCR